MKLGYVPGPPTARDTRKITTHGVLMDDLKIYTTGGKQMEKVINELTDAMKSIGLTLGMDKCATLAIVRGQETVTGKIEL